MGLMDKKVVVVTGGGNGIGRAYCQGIAKEGGAVVVPDINDAAAEGVAKAIADSGGISAVMHRKIVEENPRKFYGLS